MYKILYLCYYLITRYYPYLQLIRNVFFSYIIELCSVCRPAYSAGVVLQPIAIRRRVLRIVRGQWIERSGRRPFPHSPHTTVPDVRILIVPVAAHGGQRLEIRDTVPKCVYDGRHRAVC